MKSKQKKLLLGGWLGCSQSSRTLIQSSEHLVCCCLCMEQSSSLERPAGTSAEFHSFCWTSFSVCPRHVPTHTEDPPLALTLHRLTNHFLWKISKNNFIRKCWLCSFWNVEVNKNTATRKCILQRNHFSSPGSSGKVWGNHCYVDSPDTQDTNFMMPDGNDPGLRGFIRRQLYYIKSHLHSQREY